VLGLQPDPAARGESVRVRMQETAFHRRDGINPIAVQPYATARPKANAFPYSQLTQLMRTTI